MILCILFGVTRGVYVIYHSLLMTHVVGPERGHHGFGVYLTCMGIILIIAMPCFGSLTEATHDAWGYNIAFIGIGAFEILAGFISVILALLLKKSNHE